MEGTEKYINAKKCVRRTGGRIKKREPEIYMNIYGCLQSEIRENSCNILISF